MIIILSRWLGVGLTQLGVFGLRSGRQRRFASCGFARSPLTAAPATKCGPVIG